MTALFWIWWGLAMWSMFAYPPSPPPPPPPLKRGPAKPTWINLRRIDEPGYLERLWWNPESEPGPKGQGEKG